MRLNSIHRSLRSNGDPSFEGTMMTRDPNAFRGGRAAVAAVCLLLALAGCGLDKVTVPGLSGPSELGLSFKLTVSPDILTADGISTASVQVAVRGPNGQPLGGRDIFFAITDEGGTFADIGSLSSNRAVSNGNGIAQVIYTAPARTDFTANGSILILARPVTDDANGQIYREVRLELRSPEPKLFPPKNGNKGPNCAFTAEDPEGLFVGKPILFQDTSTDTDGFIVRYVWDFGDGTRDDKPDVVHYYTFAATYTVNHKVTDNNGADGFCFTTFTISP